MLQKLLVSNFALIRELDLSFAPGLTTITGETGAGKSIMLGALSLVLGQRADLQQVSDKSRKCVVEAWFQLESDQLKAWFEEQDLDFDRTVIMRRELATSGASRAFINDTPVVLPVMKELGMQLIDIHSQHETLQISNAAFKFDLLDNHAGQLNQLNLYQIKFKEWSNGEAELAQLLEEEGKLSSEMEYNKFILSELDEAEIASGELAEAENELEILSNAETIRESLNKIFQYLEGKDESILSQLNEVRSLFRSTSDHPEAREMAARFESAYLELKELSQDAGRLGESVSSDPERAELLGGRINLINNLLLKHRVSDEGELIAFREQIREKLNQVHDLSDRIEKLRSQNRSLKTDLSKKAEALSAGRKKSASKLPFLIEEKLKELGMPHARLQIELNRRERLNEYGSDEVRILFSANKGSDPGELSKIASGGELSRLMFCIKSLSGSSGDSPVLIFDEIDAGVSGEVAGKLGAMMSKLAVQRQMICITHLPQVASKGQEHLYVYKTTTGGKTWSEVRKLSHEERLEELARMLSGEKVTRAAFENARQLLSESGII